MRIAPEFIAVAVWSVFVSGVVILDTAETVKGPIGQSNAAQAKLITGRSAAISPTAGVYGALFVDPTLQEAPVVYKGPKPTSADLTAP
jgi:hypothetical protein